MAIRLGHKAVPGASAEHVSTIRFNVSTIHFKHPSSITSDEPTIKPASDQLLTAIYHCWQALRLLLPLFTSSQELPSYQGSYWSAIDHSSLRSLPLHMTQLMVTGHSFCLFKGGWRTVAAAIGCQPSTIRLRSVFLGPERLISTMLMDRYWSMGWIDGYQY